MLQATSAQAEGVSKSSNKIHKTWGLPFSRALYHKPQDLIEFSIKVEVNCLARINFMANVQTRLCPTLHGTTPAAARTSCPKLPIRKLPLSFLKEVQTLPPQMSLDKTDVHLPCGICRLSLRDCKGEKSFTHYLRMLHPVAPQSPM